ncbi:receptor-type tyrosine-protein phosphatase zeta-like isoform X2, partial [Clarias magur]
HTSQPTLSTSTSSSTPRISPGHASSSMTSISDSMTSSTSHPDVLLPTIKTSTSPKQQWLTVEPQTFPPDQPKTHDRRPSSHAKPEDEDVMLVTYAHSDGSQSRTTVSSPNDDQLGLPSVLNGGVRGHGKVKVWRTKPHIDSVTSAPDAESRTIYVTRNSLLVSMKHVNEPTQPVFN